MKKKYFRVIAFVMMAIMFFTSIDTWSLVDTALASDDGTEYIVNPTTIDTVKADGDAGKITWSINLDGVLSVEGYGFPTNLKSVDCAVTPEKKDKIDVWPWYEHNDKITTAEISLGNVSSLKAMFYECENIQKIDFKNVDSSKVTDMSFMFAGCSKLILGSDIGLAELNTQNAINMSYMFCGCDLDEKALNGFDTSKVIDMTSMFEKSTATYLDLSSFDTSKVTSMKNMFKECRLLKEIDASAFDTSSVTDMSGMFYCCEEIQFIDVSSFNTSKVKNMNDMFYGCALLPKLDLSSFDCSGVESLDNMFYDNLRLVYFKAPSKSNLDIKFLRETESTPEAMKFKDLEGADYESVPKVVSANAVFFIVDPDMNIKKYKEDHKDCKLTVKKNDNVTVFPDSRVFDNIFYDSVKIRVRPNEGYEIESLLIDDENLGEILDYELVFYGKDHTVEAIVKPKSSDDKDEYKAMVDADGAESVLTSIIVKNGKAYDGLTGEEITEERLNEAYKKGEAFEGYYTKDGTKITLDNIVEIVKKGEQIYARFAIINVVVGQSINVNSAIVCQEGMTKDDITKYQILDENNEATKAVKKLATINKNGTVKTKKAGNIIVVGFDSNGVKIASLSLKLVPMKVDKTAVKNKKLGLPGISANVLDYFTDTVTNSNKITWSMKGKLATLDKETGIIKVNENVTRSGKVTVTAELENTAFSEDCPDIIKHKKFKVSISIKLPKQGGKTVKVKAGATKKCSLKNTTGLDVKWSSADASIAEVDENGVVKGKVSGQTTTVTALVSKDGVEKTYNYTINVK